MVKKINMNKEIKNNKGSVLIMTIIITSILFSIGISFAIILERQVVNQIFLNKSQVAINIANSAYECVLYNEFRRALFEEGNSGREVDCGPFYNVYQVPTSSSTSSEWSNYTLIDLEERQNEVEYEFEIVENINTENVTPACARVTLQKTCPVDATGICPTEIQNELNIRGFDRCENPSTEERSVVRRLRVFY